MQLSNAPPKIVEAFAVNAAPSGGYGGKRTVPVPSQIAFRPGAASYNDGFPPLTMTPLPGGVPMSGLDMNGILNEATAIDWWKSAGAGWVFDATFAAAVGGYPAGARVFMGNGQGYWLNIVDNNSTNPDTGSAPTGWIPERAVASVYASTAQTLAIFNSKVLWDTVEFDTFGLWDAADKRFKALWQGIYRLTGSIYIPASAGQNLSTMIYKNGALAKQACQFPQVSNVALSLPFDAQVYCNEGDYLETYMNIQQTAVSVGAGSGSNAPYVFGQIHYLGYA